MANGFLGTYLNEASAKQESEVLLAKVASQAFDFRVSWEAIKADSSKSWEANSLVTARVVAWQGKEMEVILSAVVADRLWKFGELECCSVGSILQRLSLSREDYEQLCSLLL